MQCTVHVPQGKLQALYSHSFGWLRQESLYAVVLLVELLLLTVQPGPRAQALAIVANGHSALFEDSL